jgi:hypothetical protein
VLKWKERKDLSRSERLGEIRNTSELGYSLVVSEPRGFEDGGVHVIAVYPDFIHRSLLRPTVPAELHSERTALDSGRK